MKRFFDLAGLLLALVLSLPAQDIASFEKKITIKKLENGEPGWNVDTAKVFGAGKQGVQLKGVEVPGQEGNAVNLGIDRFREALCKGLAEGERAQ